MTTPAAFHRDRLTLYGYVTLSAYVWGIYGLGPALLLMRDETGMSRTMASLHSSGVALGVLSAGIFTSAIIRAWGRAHTLSRGAVSASLGLLGLATGHVPWISLPSAVLLGFGGSIAVNALNAAYSVRLGMHAAAAIGESNAMAVLAGMIAPLTMGALVAAGLNWRLALVIPVIMFAIGYAMRGDARELDLPAEEHHDAGTRLPHAYWWGWLVMMLCVAAEFAFVLWSGDVIRDQAHVSVATAASALSAISLGMVIARFTITQLSRRFDIERVFLISLFTPILAWVPMWLSHSATVILGCLFVIGLGLGYHFPLAMNRLLVAAPGMPDAAAARSSLASGIAIGASPFALAALSNVVGLHTAFAMVPVLLGLAVIVVATHRIHP